MNNTIVASLDSAKPLKNILHEKFCSLYATSPELFGNTVDCYLETFNIDRSNPHHRTTASKCAHGLMKNSIILARINFLMETRLGFNDADVDKQLAFCIAQSSDLRVKLGGIREYNALKGRIRAKLDITYTETSDDELNDELKAIESELTQAQALLDSRRASKSKAAEIPGMPNLTEAQSLAVNDEQKGENGLQKPSA